MAFIQTKLYYNYLHFTFMFTLLADAETSEAETIQNTLYSVYKHLNHIYYCSKYISFDSIIYP